MQNDLKELEYHRKRLLIQLAIIKQRKLQIAATKQRIKARMREIFG